MTAAEEQTTEVICSFCVKPTTEVETIVAGPGVYICNECVGLCVELIESKPKNTSANMPALASWQERLSDNDLLAMLPKVAATSAQVDAQLTIAVKTARARGITWRAIGSALGMTRQSAWERFSGEE